MLMCLKMIFLFFYIAPMLIGGRDAKTPVEGEGIERLSDSLKLEFDGVLRLGTDAALTGKIKKG